MSKTLLLHTLGNRDLQFARNAPLPGDFIRDYTVDNQEDPNYVTLIKKKEDQTFRAACRYLLDLKAQQASDFAYIERVMEFPLITRMGQYVQSQGLSLDRLLLVATHQAKPYMFDTDLCAELAMPILTTQFGPVVEIEYANINPKVDSRSTIITLFHTLLKAQRAEGFDRIYISNQQGLPATTEALNFVGLFQGYTYLQVEDQQTVRRVSHLETERILADLIKNRIIHIIQATDLVPTDENT